MDKVLAGLGHRFGGILNGLDTAVWDPGHGRRPAGARTRGPIWRARPHAGGRCWPRSVSIRTTTRAVLGMIGRLDPQKGFDLLAGAAKDLLVEGGRIVVLGTGDAKLMAELRTLARSARPRRCREGTVRPRPGAAHLRRRGPVRHAVALRAVRPGPDDRASLRHAGHRPPHRRPGRHGRRRRRRPGRGHRLRLRRRHTAASLLDACRRAMSHYHAGGIAWAELQDRGMAIDWSWEAGPAEQYAATYRRAVSLRKER